MSQSLYSVVDKDTLHNIVEAFYGCIKLPIQVIDEDGNFLESFGDTGKFCSFFQKHLPPEDTCQKMHVGASKRAISLGEPYIFSCHAHLNHIVYPLICKDKFLGSILLGPFLMDEPDSTLISDISKKYHLNIDDTLRLFEESGSIALVSPEMVNHINKLLFFLFCNLIDESKEQLKLNNRILSQQSKISEAIQRYKNMDTTVLDYPYEKERELITKVKTGNLPQARAILNDLLGYVLFSEGNSLDYIKARAIELCSLLSRVAIEGGAPTDNILKLNNSFLKSLQQIDTLDLLCAKLQEIVEAFTDSLFDYSLNKNRETIKKAMNYISTNFNHSITLEEVAVAVHLHPAYFSSIFTQCSGSSFKEYLNMVRVEESKRLLSNTEYSIIDIAVACGFDDQSYFSKVFKKYTGMSPKQYR